MRPATLLRISAACAMAVVMALGGWSGQSLASPPPVEMIGSWQGRIVPILGTALTRERQAVGVVAHVLIAVKQRDDDNGLELQFLAGAGRFSPIAQAAASVAIRRAAKAAGVDSNTLSVRLAVPFARTTIYGKSLSAMVGLTVISLLHHDPVLPDRVITGTIESDGHIGSVGGLRLKIEAADAEHFKQVLVPQEYEVTEEQWDTPFLMHVWPVRAFEDAYEAMTGRALLAQAQSLK